MKFCFHLQAIYTIHVYCVLCIVYYAKLGGGSVNELMKSGWQKYFFFHLCIDLLEMSGEESSDGNKS